MRRPRQQAETDRTEVGLTGWQNIAYQCVYGGAVLAILFTARWFDASVLDGHASPVEVGATYAAGGVILVVVVVLTSRVARRLPASRPWQWPPR